VALKKDNRVRQHKKRKAHIEVIPYLQRASKRVINSSRHALEVAVKWAHVFIFFCISAYQSPLLQGTKTLTSSNTSLTIWPAGAILFTSPTPVPA
jgi:hypothetical protein